MIDLYSWDTPNGYKPLIALEEMELKFKIIWVDILNGEQFAPEFLRISPNNRIPAIVDEGFSLFESGAILQYLARKTGKFYGDDPQMQATIDQWLHWQIGGIGPMFGQAYHFLKTAPQGNEYGIERYMTETKRLLSILDNQLNTHEYVAGPYSIADMAIHPWIRSIHLVGIDWAEFPHVKSYVDKINEREAVKRAYAHLPG